MEEMRIDYSMVTRTPFGTFDNDASSCYDRILIPISSLIARGYGIHQNVVFVHATNLEQARYKLKIGKTTAPRSYSHTTQFPIHGSGQGAANSPTIWCVISSKLFQCHQEKSFGMTMHSPEGDITLHMSMVGFVDDSTCLTGGNHQHTVKDMLNRMQSDAQLWNDILWPSGGKLELPQVQLSFDVLFF